MTHPTSKLPNLTKETEDFISMLEKQDCAPLYLLSVKDARKFLNDLQAKSHKNIPAEIEDVSFQTDIDREIKARIVKPQNAAGKLPIIMYYHGGGWVLGDKDTHDMLIRKLANCTNCAVVFVEYTPAPEARYPQPVEEAYRALEYVYEHADEYGLNKEKIALAGDSAGGNMAAVVALMAKNKEGPKISFQALFYPVTNADLDTQSYNDFSQGPWLTKKAMEWFWDAYVPDKAKRQDIYVSPLRASSEQLEGLPPALVVTDENDVLRDEGEAYALKLMDAGVEVFSVRINGTHHDFMMLNALWDSAPTKGAIILACEILKKALHGNQIV